MTSLKPRHTTAALTPCALHDRNQFQPGGGPIPGRGGGIAPGGGIPGAGLKPGGGMPGRGAPCGIPAGGMPAGGACIGGGPPGGGMPAIGRMGGPPGGPAGLAAGAPDICKPCLVSYTCTALLAMLVAQLLLGSEVTC